MALDERVKASKLRKFLIQQDLSGILSHCLVRDDLILLGMKSPAFSQYTPSSRRRKLLNSVLNSVSHTELTGNKGADTLVGILNGEIYDLKPGRIFTVGQVSPGSSRFKEFEPNVPINENFDQLVHGAITILDRVNNNYNKLVEAENYITLKRRLEPIKDELINSGEVYNWIYALATSSSITKNLLASELSTRLKKGQWIIKLSTEDHYLAITELMNDLNKMEEDRLRLAQQVVEVQKQRDEKSSALETVESERNKLRLDYERLEREYRTLEATTKELQEKIKELGSRPEEDSKELTARIKALEEERATDRRIADENIALSESYLDDMGRQREAYDLETRKLQARISGLTRLLERYNGNGTAPHEKTMEEIFVDAGLDYELITAVVVGGSQNLTRRAGTPLTVTNWRKNTLGKLADKSKIGQFEAAVDMLVGQGVLIQINRGVLSVNSNPDGVANPVLKMYLADVLKDPTKYRS